ncbi:MAG: hypothetical protein CL878_11365 [Dehalococcoidia bacterium]|nr:hypothetical protein [Dehalococcoidia bacterium]
MSAEPNRYRAGIIGLSGIAASRTMGSIAGNQTGTETHPALGNAQVGSHAAAYHLVPETDVIAVCELRTELFDSFRDTWGDVWPNVHTYSDYREMLDQENLDLLSVVTSDHLHADMVVDAAAAGVHGIFCEKPMATTLADADRMIAACEQHGTTLSIDHTRRFKGMWHEVRDLVQSEALGRLRAIVMTMGYPRAMLFRNGTHMIDMLGFLSGAEPEWVVAELDDGFEDYGPVYAGDGGRDPRTDPGGYVLLRFRNGVRVQIAMPQTESGTISGFHLICDRGGIHVSDHGAEVWEPGGDALSEHRRSLLPSAYSFDGQRSGIAELVQHLAARDAGREPQAPLISPASAGRQTLEIMLGILRSHHEGNAKITFPLAGDA